MLKRYIKENSITSKYYYNESLSNINKSLNKANANNIKLFSLIDLNLFDV